MNNIDIVRQGYKNFSEGKIEDVLALFDPEIVWEESTGFPYVQNDGIFHGPKEIVENIFANIPIHMDNFMIHIDDLIDAGEKVVMTGHYGGTWKENGNKFMANAAHVWTLKGGKVVHFFQAADTAAIMGDQ
jgi:ketosteroid isomerase-like protein